VNGQVQKESEAKTDETGRYSIMLSDGTWRGMPCGSATGYLPVYWEITSTGGEITDFRELRREAPTLHSVDIGLKTDRFVIKAGDPVTLTGDGFGCSGQVRVDVEGSDPSFVSAFNRQQDGVLKFGFPALQAANAGNALIVRKVTFSYLQGAAQSNSVNFTVPTGVGVGLPEPQIGPEMPSAGAGSSSTTTEMLQMQVEGALPQWPSGSGGSSGGGQAPPGLPGTSDVPKRR